MFDDGPLTAFFATHDALNASEHWFVHDGVPTLTMVVRYRDVPSGPRPGAERPDPPIEVEPEHRAVFEALRKWRNDRARRDGRPPYVLFNNSQLASIARARPDTRAALEALPGVGEGRIRDYADDLLALRRPASGGLDPRLGLARGHASTSTVERRGSARRRRMMR